MNPRDNGRSPRQCANTSPQNNFSWWCHAHASQWHPPFALKEKTKRCSKNLELWEVVLVKGGQRGNRGNDSWRCFHGKAWFASLQRGLNVFVKVHTGSGVFFFHKNATKYLEEKQESNKGQMMVVCVECHVLFMKKLKRERKNIKIFLKRFTIS